jgi:folate-dependent phosphoribosylglycinamide formyltransferase PurN
VTSGYGRSLHAIALLHQLKARGHEVPLCVSVRVLNAARLRSYVRQLGWKKFQRKVWAKLRPGAQPRSAGAQGEVAPMLAYLRQLGVSTKTVSDACADLGIREHHAHSLNDADALDALRAAAPDLVVYAGGGIVRKPFIDTARIGVLNAHGGPLPAFRGMNSGEWALFHGVAPEVTIHLIDTGIDTGPILLRRPVPVQAWREIPLGRGESTRVGVEALLEAVDLIAAGRHTLEPQAKDAGRQFFVMADPLLELLQRWIAEGRTPARKRADMPGDQREILPHDRNEVAKPALSPPSQSHA